MSTQTSRVRPLRMCLALFSACVIASAAGQAVQQTPAGNTAGEIAAYEDVIASYNTGDSAKSTAKDADYHILTEAFVVEVSTEGLKELGVSPLGQSSDGISIAKLTACLVEGKNAKVISGAKAAAKPGKEGSAKEEKRIYLKEIRKNSMPNIPGSPAVPEAVDVQFRDYNFDKTFRATPTMCPNGVISLEYEYGEFGVLTDGYDPENPAPPTKYSYGWSGQLSLSPGKPQIAASVQNKDSIIFLILTATIQKENPAEKSQAKTDEK